MLVKEILDIYELLDSAYADGARIEAYLKQIQAECDISVNVMKGDKGQTDTIKIVIPGKEGKLRGGQAPTLGLIGRLGGLGARPKRTGFVSDGDGALTVLAAAAKLLKMQKQGDVLTGDVIISTHICPNAPTLPHIPVPFMGSPVSMEQMNETEVDQRADAILSVDTTKGNRILNHKGFAISPTVKDGYILKVSDDLLELMEITTGDVPQVFALATQDITPYGNGLTHLNSILQPATATHAPVVGVAICTRTTVPGCATGAASITSIDEAARFVVEAAKAYTRGECSFYDINEYEMLSNLYGSMRHLSTFGGQVKNSQEGENN